MTPRIGVAELAILTSYAVSIALAAWALIDASGRSEAQWAAVDRGKIGWALLIVLGSVLCLPVGLVASIYYLAAIRPRLEASGRTSPDKTLLDDL